MTDDFARVQAALRDRAAPDLGVGPDDLELIAFEDGIASVRLGAACASCPATIQPLVMQLEASLRAAVPAVEMVEAVA